MKKLTLGEANTKITQLEKQIKDKVSECNAEVYACKKSCMKTFSKGAFVGAAILAGLILISKLF